MDATLAPPHSETLPSGHLPFHQRGRASAHGIALRPVRSRPEPDPASGMAPALAQALDAKDLPSFRAAGGRNSVRLRGGAKGRTGVDSGRSILRTGRPPGRAPLILATLLGPREVRGSKKVRPPEEVLPLCGNLEPRKNLSLLMRAFKEADLPD